GGCNADETRYFQDATRADTKRHERKRHEGRRAATFRQRMSACETRGIRAWGAQCGGGAGPRTAVTKCDNAPFGGHHKVQTRERLNRLAVVMLPPCPSPALAATAMHTFRFFEVFLGLLRVVRLLQARRHEAHAYVHPR